MPLVVAMTIGVPVPVIVAMTIRVVVFVAIVPTTQPVGVPMVTRMTAAMTVRMITTMQSTVNMTLFIVALGPLPPLRMGVSAGFAVVVTASFDVAGVGHGGFLAGFVV